MARKKFSKRKFKKFGKRKFRKGKRNVRTSFEKSLVISDRQIIRLKYVDGRTLTTAGPAIVQYNYNLNSLFDPDQSGVGSQPAGFDQWSAFYNRYRVYSVFYKVNFVTHANTGSGMVLAVIPTNGVTAYTTLAQVLENPRAKSSVAQISGHIAKVKGKAWLPSINGRTNATYRGSDLTAALTTASPGEVITLSVVGASIDQVTVPNFDILVEIWYKAEMFDKITLDIS